MRKSNYIDFDLIKQYHNKYNITPKKIKKLMVLDWDRLKKETWFNRAMSKPCWCHIEGSNHPNSKNKYEDDDEFWIGFYEDGRVDCNFSAYEGMCSYQFEEFYKIQDIECKYDMYVQVNAIKYLNMLLDEGIVYLVDNNKN